jgi:hypothetical protein
MSKLPKRLASSLSDVKSNIQLRLTGSTTLPAGTIEKMFKMGHLNLDLAGILFVQACKHVELGTASYKGLNEEIEKHAKLLADCGDKIFQDESDDNLTKVIHSLSALEDKYAPVVTHFGVASILLVSSAESHINDISSAVLTGAEAEQFDKLTPVGKWLFLPKLMGLSFKPELGKAPMQDFDKLVKRRNRLIHAKPMRQTGLQDIPRFVEDLKMKPDEMARSLESVRQLIREFSLSWKGSYGPDWLNRDGENYRDPCFYFWNAEVPMRLGRAGDDKAS